MAKNTGTIVRLLDGRTGVCYDKDQKFMCKTPKLDAWVCLVDEDMKPIMSKRFPNHQAAIMISKTELKIIGHID